MNLWPHQETGIDAVVGAIHDGERRICLTSPTGMGKCLALGTPVLMFDGSIRPVESIVTGDALMGPDSQSRIVLGTTRGVGELYEVTPTKGDAYVVNADHILALRMTGGARYADIADGESFTIPVKEYTKSSLTFRHCAKGYRAGVDWGYRPIPLDPYYLGLWLGDGTATGPHITTADTEVMEFLRDMIAPFADLQLSVSTKPDNAASTYRISGLPVPSGGERRWRANPILAAMKALGVLRNKHIPEAYKANSRQVRLRLLAGLIDSDGYRCGEGYDLVFKIKGLADGTAYIARSLGLAAYVKACRKTCTTNRRSGTYYRVSISGNTDMIPVLIERKRAMPRRQKKDALVHGITVNPVGVGEYAGFELSDDGLFLLGDFTVTHNSKIVCYLIKHFTQRGWYAVLYSNRRMLIEQLQGVLSGHGIECGVRAAGHRDDRDCPVQISSIPTEAARTIKEERWVLHGHGRPCLAVVDEAHLNNGPTAKQLMEQHVEQGHAVLGISATPIDIGDSYSKLVVAGTVSEGRKCGALLPCRMFGPDEPDLRAIKLEAGEDISEQKQRKVFGDGRKGGDDRIKQLFGRVLPWFRKLNPESKPSILFASGVPESMWFAQEFSRVGIPAAHIDGKECWLDGKRYPTTPELRGEILERSKCGDVRVLCNRFVLREGVDAPWLAHGVFATAFGSLQSYLQSGGRLLRSHPSLAHVTLQDHGGSWHRHGSLNADRIWELGCSNASLAGQREDRLRARDQDGNPVAKEPWRCPQCGMILGTPECFPPTGCGYEPKGRPVRPVVQSDGTLKEMTGDIFTPRRVAKFQGAVKKWVAMYFRSRNGAGRTFRQAEALFAAENHWNWPCRDWPFMPTFEIDWWRKVADVPRERLRGES